MRTEAAVTSISWIPSEAVQGMMKMPFESGVAHYDVPPPEAVEGLHTLDELAREDRFRFANRLEAWIEVVDGRIVDHGQRGGGRIGSTTMKIGRKMTFEAVALPERRPDPEVGDGWVRFSQTAGGRTGVPTPRRVNHPPFVQYHSPLAWTTLSLTIHADGRTEHQLTGASNFPRHWVYGPDGKLSHKSGLVDFKEWYRHSFGKHSPWGDEDSPALVAEVETALERELSVQIMRGGAKPKIRKVRQGELLARQGQPGDELFLLLDGILSVEVDEEPLAEVGPGALLGERAVLEGGTRTSTLRAQTDCRVAVAPADAVDREKLLVLSEGHRREENQPQ
ncbi:MAG: cyclic nucleotide-binding domain-containing protein [Actinobacteria bacterium]|nr:cyclic nucleotide-binding domain-containing protein [Actinomycetota bacterium]MBW3649700.1 cyclic nucleotide-binding domain-containing protein [Actinomycetota bacterium]